MRKSKHARLVLVALFALLATGCAGNGVQDAELPTLKASTLEEAIAGCDTLPSAYVADCKVAAYETPWGE